MKIYPAIDILGSKAVRLIQGRKQDAMSMAIRLKWRQWISKGADWLHVVDLEPSRRTEKSRCSP
jgi:phosphoribosylformimino-5-aminoimidazole carboxamide ribotide isomerase